MIDAYSSFSRFTAAITDRNDAVPFLRWVEEWRQAFGRGVVVGLLDTHFDKQISDLAGADLIARNFVDCENGIPPETTEHGTHSVATLVGQGLYQIRGIAPKARLLVAHVVGQEGIAKPQAVVEAIDWLISSGAQIVALPLGESVERAEIARQIEQGSEFGVVFFAAAGNSYPELLAFPARHPLAIAVGATDFLGNLLPECSRLPRLDIVAPGWKSAAPIRGRIIRRRRGSSVACVVAAGVAALALSAGAISPKELCRTSVLAVLRMDLERNKVRYS